MTIIEFIKSQLSKENALGDLARDISYDKNFPFSKSIEEIVFYLESKAHYGGTGSLVTKLISEYEKQKDIPVSNTDIESRFAVLTSEQWNHYKDLFPIHKVILVGTSKDYYRVYCVDATRKVGLCFKLNSATADLSNLPIYEEEYIHIGELTAIVSVQDAIKLLESCEYSLSKPNFTIYNGLIEILKLNLHDSQ